MSKQDLVVEFSRTREQWDAFGAALVPLAEQLAFQTVAEALPGAARIEMRGEINEDWLRILRIQRVLSGGGHVLFDVAEGHGDRHIEDAIDETNADYLDLLLDLTSDLYMGNHTLEPERDSS